MPHRLLLAFLLTFTLAPLAAVADDKAAPPVVSVESSLKSATGHVRQFAFDGNAKTYFASADNAKASDHFTLAFDTPVTVKSVTVTTGRPKGTDRLTDGILEGSADGKSFEVLAKFAEGTASAKPKAQKLRALRIKSGADLKHPLVICEIAIDAEPAVVAFKYPIEFTVDVSDAPEMKKWAEDVARVCERNYTMICDELASDGFTPRTTITMTLKKSYKGVAEASGGRITGSVSYFKSNPKDVGAMIHETVHCVQLYRTRGAPGWLVEGIADYVRFFKYEPGKIGRINADKARYNGSYRTSAAFLAYVSDKYDKQLVKKLNKALREGEYSEAIWKVLTKKTVTELDEEWRASMKKAK